METVISLAELSDLQNISELVNSAYRGDSSRKGWTTEADLLGGQRIDTQMLQEQLKNKNEHILVARFKDQKEIIGCVAIALEAPTKIYIGMVTVDPNIQAQGIGRQLLAAAENFGQSQNCSSSYMTVIHKRTSLIEWYERRGYKKTGDVVQFPEGPQFGIPQTKDLHLIVLSKSL